MSYRGFFCLVTLLLTANAFAMEFEDPNTLQKEITSHLADIYKAEFGEQEFNDNIEISVSNLDPRLRLKKCNGEKHFTVVSPHPSSANVTTKMSCRGDDVRWSIHVPSQVSIYGEVATIKHSLKRGAILTEADIELTRVNISKVGYGHIRDISRAIGKELRRPIRPGEPIKLSHLIEPKAIQRGDQVILEAQQVGLSVAAPGTAMTNGKVGEHIRVRNNDSKRVVDALVVAPGRVRITL